MCRRNIRESLTARIFLLTLLLLLGAGGLTFGLIAWATPITYVSVVGDRLQVQVNELTDRLALTKLADAGPILDVFVRESGAAVSLASPDGESVDTGSLYVSVTTAVQESDSVSTYTYGADGGRAQREGAGHYVTTALSDALIAEVDLPQPENGPRPHEHGRRPARRPRRGALLLVHVTAPPLR